MITTGTSRLSVLLATLVVLGMTTAMADPLPRPRLENYSDYNQFLTDMANYRKHLHDGQAAGSDDSDDQTTLDKPKPDSIAVASPITDADIDSSQLPPAAAVPDPTREDAPPPIVINGPEDLDTAVEEAKSFIHPIYKVAKRFNRTTSQSFPLAQLDPLNLERSSVGGIWYGPDALPSDRTDLDQDTLQNQADTATKAKQAADSRKAEQTASDAVDGQEADDDLIKALGAQPILFSPPQIQTYFPGSSDPGHAAVFGITLESGTTSVVPHDGPHVPIPASAVNR